MAKTSVRALQIGDIVEGISWEEGNRYLITKHGWKGTIKEILDNGRITVVGRNRAKQIMRYTVESRSFKLYKTKEMATKQTKDSLQLKDGMYFTATYNRKAVRGVVKEVESDSFYLCGRGFPNDADNEDEADGFPTYLEIDVYNSSFTEQLKMEKVNNFTILTDKRQHKVVDGDKMVTVEGHKVHISGDKVSFGCGAVETTKQGVRDFVHLSEKSEDIDSHDMEQIKNIFENLAEKEFKPLFSFFAVLSEYGYKRSKEFFKIYEDMEKEDVEFNQIPSEEIKALLAVL